MKITARIEDSVDSIGFCGVRLLERDEPGSHYLAMREEVALAFVAEIERLNRLDDFCNKGVVKDATGLCSADGKGWVK